MQRPKLEHRQSSYAISAWHVLARSWVKTAARPAMLWAIQWVEEMEKRSSKKKDDSGEKPLIDYFITSILKKKQLPILKATCRLGLLFPVSLLKNWMEKMFTRFHDPTHAGLAKTVSENIWMVGRSCWQERYLWCCFLQICKDIWQSFPKNWFWNWRTKSFIPP